MPPDTHIPPSRKVRVVGLVLSSVLVLLLLADAVVKLAKIDPVVKGTVGLGYPERIIIPLGIVLLVCTLLYAVPRTAVIGAILLTGYLGGAVATHARLGHPLATHTLFPIYLGVVLWLALYLRSPLLRTLVRVGN